MVLRLRTGRVHALLAPDATRAVELQVGAAGGARVLLAWLGLGLGSGLGLGLGLGLGFGFGLGLGWGLGLGFGSSFHHAHQPDDVRV